MARLLRVLRLVFVPLLIAIPSIATCAGSALPSERALDPQGAIGRPEPRGTPAAGCARINVCGTPGRALNGEAWAGGNQVWQTELTTNSLQLFDLGTCQVIRQCPAPGASFPSELTLLNGTLYHYDFGTGLIYAIDPTTCQVMATCDPPGDDLAEGLTSDGTYLYRGDSQFIYKFLPPAAAGTECQSVSTCPNPVGDSADGLTMCNDMLIMLGYSGTVYRIDFNTGTVVGACPLNDGAAGNGLTSDHVGRLWTDQLNGDLDAVDVGCQIPDPVRKFTWSALKLLAR